MTNHINQIIQVEIFLFKICVQELALERGRRKMLNLSVSLFYCSLEEAQYWGTSLLSNKEILFFFGLAFLHRFIFVQA